MITMDTCEWTTPGHAPFGGNVPAAIEHYTEIPAPVRAELRARMERLQYDDVAEIRRDTMTGAHGYTDLRSMHFGDKFCRQVSRTTWTDTMVERALIYCTVDSSYCVAVPTVCRNLSLVTRVRPPVAAVPPIVVPTPPDQPDTPIALAPPEEVDEPPTYRLPPETFEDSGSPPPPAWWPPSYITPVPVFWPGTQCCMPCPLPPLQAIPEPGTWALLLAGLVLMVRRRFT